MDKDTKEFRLSPEALKELKEIVKEEIGNEMHDSEIEEMGIRLLRLFSILKGNEEKKSVTKIEISNQERKVLMFLHEEICNQKRNPSVRDISRAAGHRSSRSGFRVLNHLISRGMVFRNHDGELQMREGICDRVVIKSEHTIQKVSTCGR